MRAHPLRRDIALSTFLEREGLGALGGLQSLPLPGLRNDLISRIVSKDSIYGDDVPGSCKAGAISVSDGGRENAAAVFT